MDTCIVYLKCRLKFEKVISTQKKAASIVVADHLFYRQGNQYVAINSSIHVMLVYDSSFTECINYIIGYNNIAV